MAINKKYQEEFQNVQREWETVWNNPNAENLKNFENVLQKFQKDIQKMVL